MPDLPAITRGEKRQYNIYITREGDEEDLSAATDIVFEARLTLDAEAIIEKSLGDGVSVLDAEAGHALLTISPEDTADFNPKRTVLHWKVIYTDSAGDPYVVLKGLWPVEP